MTAATFSVQDIIPYCFDNWLVGISQEGGGIKLEGHRLYVMYISESWCGWRLPFLIASSDRHLNKQRTQEIFSFEGTLLVLYQFRGSFSDVPHKIRTIRALLISTPWKYTYLVTPSFLRFYDVRAKNMG